MKISFSTWIIIGLISGIICGLFFGDLCGILKIAGAAYIRLIQMCVLPYIVLSLICGIGSLSLSKAKNIAINGAFLMVLLWIIGILLIFSMSLTFPKIENASFFSASNIKEANRVDLLDIYIPANPLKSMVDDMIPAVVLFSISVGIAFMLMKDEEKKKPVLNGISILSTVLSDVTGLMNNLTPLGIFALTASAAGTTSFEDLNLLKVYFLSYGLATILITFLIIPVIVSILTPFKYKDIIFYSRDILIMGITIGNIYVILPFIIENAKKILTKYKLSDKDTNSLVEVILPIFLNFPSIGGLFPILFILFTSWFYKKPLNFIQHIDLAFSGIFSLFGSSTVAIPFLLNRMRLPSDIFNLYLVARVITNQVEPMISVMCLTGFTLILICILTGLIKINLKKIFIYSLITIGIMAVSILSLKYGLSLWIKASSGNQEVLLNKHIQIPLQAKVYKNRMEVPTYKSSSNDKGKLLYEIKKRGVLRVGYTPDSMPFAYFNKSGELVGYDISTAYILAKSLGCTLEFIPVDYNSMASDLNSGLCDIVMSAVSITPERLINMDFTASYMTLQFGFIVPDYKKDQFKNKESTKSIKDLKIGINKGSTYADDLLEAFPKAKIIPMDSVEQFFKEHKADCFFTTAEQGSTWTLLYPSYKVAFTESAIYKDFIGYAIRKGEIDFLEYLNHELYILKEDGISKEEYAYWVLGQNPYEPTKRWSIIKDVLHWVE